MTRKNFLQSTLSFCTILPILKQVMTLNTLSNFTSNLKSTPAMPVLFLGHGSPMNAIEENTFVEGFRKISTQIEKPNAIVCISAHWETKGTFVTAMQNPKTIHDFGGFPQALYEVEYPAPGNPALAQEIQSLVHTTSIALDHNWGLDHGAWSVIKHLYPNADIPVIQLSIDYTKNAQYHFDLAKALSALRKKGILIIGSGNMVHNLRLVAWNKLNEQFAFDWASEENEKMKAYILNSNFEKLIHYNALGKAFELAIPSPEHYLPLIYTLGLQNNKDEVSFFNDKPVAGALTMTSVKFSNKY